METPSSRVDIPRIQFVGSAFLNHEIREEGDFRNGQEFGRALQAGGLFILYVDGSGHCEHGRHDGPKRAIDEERPFVVADFDRVFDVGLRRGGRGIGARDFQICRLVVRKQFDGFDFVGGEGDFDVAFAGFAANDDVKRLLAGDGRREVAFVLTAIGGLFPAFRHGDRP